MALHTTFPLVDEVLDSFASALGNDRLAYRNHLYRMLNYASELFGQASSLPDSVLIAAAFHDLGLWTDRTLDYLEPSAKLAGNYLQQHHLTALEAEVRAMIFEHHKLRLYRGEFAGTVEVFRRADLVDVSLGWVRFGLPAAYVRSVKQALPNAGFHARLAQVTLRQSLRSPLRPLPMLRW